MTFCSGSVYFLYTLMNILLMDIFGEVACTVRNRCRESGAWWVANRSQERKKWWWV
jgi:hypothetical protein